MILYKNVYTRFIFLSIQLIEFYISEKEIREEIVCGSPATVNVDFKVSEEEVTLATVPGMYQCRDNKKLKLEKHKKQPCKFVRLLILTTNNDFTMIQLKYF